MKRDSLQVFGAAFASTVAIFASFFSSIAFAALSCSVTTTCIGPSVVVFRMSSTTNAHAELASQSNYANLVCCDASGASLSNACSGTFTTALKLSAVTNAHVEENTGSTFTNNACLSVSGGFSVSVGYQASNCTGFDTTIASIASATGNSQVGTSTVYGTNVCGTVVAASLTFLTDSSSQTFPAHTPGTLVATSSILTITTGNTTGFNITVLRASSTGMMSLGGNGFTYIPDKTDWIAGANTATAGNATASTTLPNTLQFRVRTQGTDALDYSSAWWGVDDTSINALFGGISSTSQTIINRATSAVSTTTAYVLYNLNSPASQTSGTYSGSMTYTATANP